MSTFRPILKTFRPFSGKFGLFKTRAAQNNLSIINITTIKNARFMKISDKYPQNAYVSIRIKYAIN
jgi:hypothetical protein